LEKREIGLENVVKIGRGVDPDGVGPIFTASGLVSDLQANIVTQIL
jgi:hypothetical protein